MSVAIKQLVPPIELAAAPAALFTAQTGQAAQIYQATVCNTDAANQTFSIFIVPPAGAATDATVLYKDKSIAASETLVLSALVNHVLNAGMSVFGGASVASQLTFAMSGMVRSQ